MFTHSHRICQCKRLGCLGPCNFTTTPRILSCLCSLQERRKHLKLGGGHDTSRALFLKKKGAFSKNEKGTSLFIAKSWGGGHMPPVSPGSYVYTCVAKLEAYG